MVTITNEQGARSKPRGKRWLSYVIGRMKFSVASFLWLTLLSAVLLLWYRDHQTLVDQLEVRNAGDRNAWSVDQMLGKPNTKGYGDISTAWASASPDASEEWVVVEFANTVLAMEVHLYETFNPGAVVSISSVSMTGAETFLWEGTDPSSSLASSSISKIKLSKNLSTRRLKIRLDSVNVNGWNELDAIGLVDSQGNTQWVSKAWASSSYGANREIPKWFWP